MVDCVSVASGVIVNVNRVTSFKSFESGKDKFVLVVTIDVAGGMAGNNKITELARESLSARNGKLGDTMLHGVHNGSFVIADIKMDGNIDVKFRDEKFRLWPGSFSDGGVNRANT